MKARNLVFALLIILGFSCKQETGKSQDINEDSSTVVQEDERTPKQADGLTLLKGEFLYYADAAVLQTHREVYGVVVDEKMHELDDMTKAFKTEITDMVPVEIRGKIIQKPEGEEGWPFRVEIKEILKVSKPKDNSDKIITIGQ
ncbi:MAG: hypothetical protein KJO49_13000 [Bacteroidia bacterium]|nr:hypothetical protein [Bacteroidia bacterium]MBT8268972.1 hypothetical protein [Bacteroidia bacterium]NNF81318.1 hypothetical protein [Flavobacteriaceae bacterium]NNK69964.1 hypothetical protein [Flavobacteriaceae bacterium]NNL79947.1 hypothetical protein [Flavobacteriaceae bacterium]